jgi:transcriptional regulator with XRE-family HTH domain
MTLGQRILQIRTAAGLSQEAFGEKLGTSRQTVSKWELDQAVPEIAKIVLISRLFSVTTDSILVNGISTFDAAYRQFTCGVYRAEQSEIVETEQFALIYSCSADKTVLTAKLYMGGVDQKTLCAVCKRDQTAKTTQYAYRTVSHAIYANDETMKRLIGERYDASLTKSMKRTETFFVDHSHRSLPTVSEVGIKKCLEQWRMADSYQATAEHCHFFLCTGKTEYIFSIRPQDTDIYCGISYNMPFDMGMFGGGQFFRIRNYQDNSAPFCRFTCDFSYEPHQITIPTGECQLGKCVQTDRGLMWCVKRYTDEEIVLQGCGEDEYIYRRTDRRTETFTQNV